MTTSNTTFNAPSLAQFMPPWHWPAADEPTPLWLQVAGAVLALVMLVSFYLVVSGAAQHAHRQRHTDAVQADARSYCRTLPDARDRDSCAVQLGVAQANDDAP